MTLVQASICNNGNSIILIADRLLTRQIGETKYEFEANAPKITAIGDVGIGFAGVSYYAEVALSQIKGNDFDNICEDIAKCVKKLKQRLIDEQTQQFTGLSADDFFKGKYPVPENIREMIYGVIGQLHLDILALVTGFDNDNNARIVVIDETGTLYDMTNFGVASIGSGMQFSQMFFDMYDYNISTSEIDGLFFAYRAKKWSEAPAGVGRKTDILIIRKDDKNILIKDEDALMKKIDNAFEMEKNEVRNIRKKVLEKLIQDSKGELK